MGIDSVRAALQIVTGAGELTRTKALEAAGSLLALPGVGPTAARATQAAGQVSNLADELVAAASANREMVRALVRQEIESQLQRAGVATATEVTALRDEVMRLEAQVAAVSARADTAPAPAAASRPVKKAAAARKPAKKAAAKRPAKKTTAKKTTAKAGTTKKAAKKSVPHA